MCRGHNVSVQCQLQVVPCSHHGERKSWVVGWGGELTGNSGVTIPCCLWSADVLTI